MSLSHTKRKLYNAKLQHLPEVVQQDSDQEKLETQTNEMLQQPIVDHCFIEDSYIGSTDREKRTFEMQQDAVAGAVNTVNTQHS